MLPPIDLTTCAPEPLAPAIPDQSQQAERDALVQNYIAGLIVAGGDCRAKVNGLRAWREKPR